MGQVVQAAFLNAWRIVNRLVNLALSAEPSATELALIMAQSLPLNPLIQIALSALDVKSVLGYVRHRRWAVYLEFVQELGEIVVEQIIAK